MQNHQKPPLPPPLSVSQSSQLKPNSKSNSSESPHSPLRSDSPINSDSPIHDLHLDHDHHHNSFDGAIVPVENFYSPANSPFTKDATTPDYSSFSTPPQYEPQPQPLPRHIINSNRREELPPKTSIVFGETAGSGERKGRVGVRFGAVKDINASKFQRVAGVFEKVNLGLRVLEIVFCLISFSVMAADKTQGWSGDSFDRYKEYRYWHTF
ncbi:unnamed protein product [Amaranthus hypochondriacus]